MRLGLLRLAGFTQEGSRRTVPAKVKGAEWLNCETGHAPVKETFVPMGQPKRKVRRGRLRGTVKPRRARQRKAADERAMRKNMGIHPTDVLPHLIGRRRWAGMRDYAPEENGPVRVRSARAGVDVP